MSNLFINRMGIIKELEDLLLGNPDTNIRIKHILSKGVSKEELNYLFNLIYQYGRINGMETFSEKCHNEKR